MYRVIFLIISFPIFSFAQINSDETFKKYQEYFQDKSIIIYSSQNEILLPFIERTLKNLKNVRSNPYGVGNPDSYLYSLHKKYFKNYFSKVNNLNSLYSSAELFNALKEMHDINVNSEFSSRRFTTKEKLFQDEIRNEILKNDYYLYIKNHKIGNRLEYQFFLYQPNGKISNDISIAITDNLIGSENIILTLEDQNYKEEISNAIQGLFSDSNFPPIPIIKVDGVNIKNGQKIFVPDYSSVEIDASNSYDFDDFELTHHWEINLPMLNGNQKNHSKRKKLFLQKNNPIQNLKTGSTGDYSILYYTNDGSINSDTIVFELHVTRGPRAIQFDSIEQVNRIYIRNLFFNEDKTVTHNIDVWSYYNDQFIVTSNLVKDKTLHNRTEWDTLESEFIEDRLRIKTKESEIPQKFFIYAHNENSKYVSDPIIVKNRIYQSGLNSFYLKFRNRGNSIIDSTDNYPYQTLYLGFGLNLSENLEFQSGLNTNAFQIERENPINYFGFVDFRLNYYFRNIEKDFLHFLPYQKWSIGYEGLGKNPITEIIEHGLSLDGTFGLEIASFFMPLSFELTIGSMYEIGEVRRLRFQTSVGIRVGFNKKAYLYHLSQHPF